MSLVFLYDLWNSFSWIPFVFLRNPLKAKFLKLLDTSFPIYIWRDSPMNGRISLKTKSRQQWCRENRSCLSFCKHGDLKRWMAWASLGQGLTLPQRGHRSGASLVDAMKTWQGHHWTPDISSFISCSRSFVHSPSTWNDIPGRSRGSSRRSGANPLTILDI